MNALQTYLGEERGRSIKLAKMLGVSPGAISQWDRVPAERVVEVERATGISRYELRPDLYDRGNKKNAPLKKNKEKPKSIMGLMKGMVTLPQDFNPEEPFWELHKEWEDFEIGGMEGKK
jgi:Putative antitoxin of bacterial toxin-antitoxin system, YdaS/YdaT